MESTIESEVSSVLAQLIDQVSSEAEDVNCQAESSSSFPTAESATFSLASTLSSQLDKFNELTDDQLLDIRITECHTTILTWNPNPYKKLKTK